jgi:hypothetical protein
VACLALVLTVKTSSLSLLMRKFVHPGIGVGRIDMLVKDLSILSSGLRHDIVAWVSSDRVHSFGVFLLHISLHRGLRANTKTRWYSR